MKKFLGLATGLLLSAFTMAQQGASFNDATSEYDKSATTAFNFTLDANYSLEDITNTAEFYPDYFTVVAVPEGDGHIVTFTLTEDTEMSRRVISRFFVSLEITEIDVNGDILEINEFSMTYLM